MINTERIFRKDYYYFEKQKLKMKRKEKVSIGATGKHSFTLQHLNLYSDRYRWTV